MFRIEHNVETNEVLQIPLSDEEITARLLAEEKLNKLRIEKQVEQAKAEAAIWANKKMVLDKIGLTIEEAKLLLS